jgi:hypothetical protein
LSDEVLKLEALSGPFYRLRDCRGRADSHPTDFEPNFN